MIEIIFVILITAIILVVAIPKLFFNINDANIIKLKSDVAFIRNAIIKYNDNQTILNTNTTLSRLDNNDKSLFNTILNTPIISNPNHGANWSQTSQNTYRAWIDTQVYVEFIFDNTHMSFNCDFDTKYCKELSQ